MTKKMLTAACALALGVAWTMAPAIAADDTAKGKMENAKDATKDKMDTAKDKMGNAVDKTKDKASEVTDKTKSKAAEIKDTIKNKVSGRDGSDDVRRAQEALQAKGMNPGPIDGKMGPQTRAAIKDFQQKESIKVTGRLDSETKDRLNGATKTSTTSSTTGTGSTSSTTTNRAADTAPPSASPSTSPSTRQ